MKFVEKKQGKLTRLLVASLFCATSFSAVSAFANCGANHEKKSCQKLYNGKPVKYVFLMIGDGMAVTQVNVSRKYNQKPLTIDAFPVRGLTFTASLNRFITDSGAAATAMATGTKTGQTMLSVDINGRPLYTVATKAKKYSKRKVGIISTASINHATPAAFYATEKSRSSYYAIGKHLANSSIDFYGGGGVNHYNGDEGSVYELAKKNDFEVIRTKDGFNNLKNGQYKKVFLTAPRLRGDASMQKSIDSTKDDVSLAQITAKAIEVLDNDNGFFIMVEGGQIDWSCHENDAATVIHETLAFDKAISVAYEFAQKHPEETLIVVAGDHETGGLRIGLSGNQFKKYYDVLSKQKVSAGTFNGKLNKLLGTFEYSEDATKISEQYAKVLPLIKECFGNDISKTQEKIFKEGFVATMRKRAGKGTDHGNWGNYTPLTVIITHSINQKAGVTWSTFNHTSAPTTVFAYGKGAKSFSGDYQNSDLGLKLMSAIGVPAKVEYVTK
ncbi:alkaline phosphatase [Lentisphaerota bacterium WC36G]|nr:alkaline phosphatase [Lentisphaerae bacterium WC36]